MARFKITCRCVACGHRWSRITKDPASADPPCPRPVRYDDDGAVVETCGTQVIPIGMDLSLNKAPATVGGNVAVKAMDETAKIVMSDYGMTDLRDDVRPGESMTPKLHPNQQKVADNFFMGGGGRRRSMPGVFNPTAHAAAALSGALSDKVTEQRSIGDMHARRVRPPVHIINPSGSR